MHCVNCGLRWWYKYIPKLYLQLLVYNTTNNNILKMQLSLFNKYRWEFLYKETNNSISIHFKISWKLILKEATSDLEHEQYLLIFPQLQTNLFYMSPESHVQREIIVRLNITRYMHKMVRKKKWMIIACFLFSLIMNINQSVQNVRYN